MDEETSKNLVDNLLKIFIYPEIEKRQKSGSIPIPFTLLSAQVVLPPTASEKNVIRLNEEVTAIAKIKYKIGIEKKEGEQVYSTDIDGLESAELTGSDNPNNAHILLLFTEEKWLLFFDFRYNKPLARAHIQRSNEFINSAEFSKENEFWGAFIENLFCASELLQKSILLIFANEIALQAKSHGPLRSQFYLFLKNTKMETAFLQTIKRLDELRGPARYLRGDLNFSKDEAIGYLNDVKNLSNEANKLIK